MARITRIFVVNIPVSQSFCKVSLMTKFEGGPFKNDFSVVFVLSYFQIFKYLLQNRSREVAGVAAL